MIGIDPVFCSAHLVNVPKLSFDITNSYNMVFVFFKISSQIETKLTRLPWWLHSDTDPIKS